MTAVEWKWDNRVDLLSSELHFSRYLLSIFVDLGVFVQCPWVGHVGKARDPTLGTCHCHCTRAHSHHFAHVSHLDI